MISTHAHQGAFNFPYQQKAVTGLLGLWWDSVSEVLTSLHTTELLSQQCQHAHTCTALTKEKESKQRQAGLTDMMTTCVFRLQPEKETRYLVTVTCRTMFDTVSYDQLHVFLHEQAGIKMTAKTRQKTKSNLVSSATLTLIKIWEV